MRVYIDRSKVWYYSMVSIQIKIFVDVWYFRKCHAPYKLIFLKFPLIRKSFICICIAIGSKDIWNGLLLYPGKKCAQLQIDHTTHTHACAHGRRHTTIWTSAWLLLTELLGTSFSEILIGIQTFSFKKMHLKMSAKWRPFCLGLNMLMALVSKSVRILLFTLFWAWWF